MHAFQNRLPEVHARLREAAIAADKESDWGICQHASDELPLNTRCVEYHEVGEGGQLVADDDTGEQHYDSGRCGCWHNQHKNT
jgi:hypothetical protein